MSEFHKPEDSFKDFIDSLFTTDSEQKSTKKLALPAVPQLEEKEEQVLLALTEDELEDVREAFLDFQEAIDGTCLYEYLYPHIEHFAEIAEHLDALIHNKIDMDDLSEIGEKDYVKVQEIRLRILNAIKKKYL